MMQTSNHIPVLLEELVESLDRKSAATVIDATLGLGGHAATVLSQIGPKGQLLGIERSLEGLEQARVRLASYKQQVKLVYGDFRDLFAIATANDLLGVDAIYFDLGLASWQIDEGYQGLSFQVDSPLDMRLESPAYNASVEFQIPLWTDDDRLRHIVNQSFGRSASTFINQASELEIGIVLRELGGVRTWREVARQIVTYRAQQSIDSTKQLVEAVGTEGPGLLAPVFQALRILVNDEYGAIVAGLAGAWQILRPGGRLAVISFHSGEHRLIKHIFRKLPGASSITRVFPSAAEIAINARSRSATLRFIQKSIY